VCLELGGIGVNERARAQRMEVAAPGFERSEEGRMAQPDVDGAVASGGESRQDPAGPRGNGGQVPVDPGDDVVHEVALQMTG